MKIIATDKFVRSVAACFLLIIGGCLKNESRMVIDGGLEPPAPTEKNDKTLLGIDSNKNGIRDDVERWINRKFPEEQHYNLRQLYKQTAREQSMLLKSFEGKTQAELYEIFTNSTRSAECGAFIFREVITDMNQASNFKVTKTVLSRLLNNSLRKEHYLKFQSNFHMMSDTLGSTSEQVKKCDFTVRK